MERPLTREEIKNNLIRKIDNISSAIKTMEEKINEYEIQKKEAAEKGDLRENTAYMTASENLMQASYQMDKLREQEAIAEEYRSRLEMQLSESQQLETLDIGTFLELEYLRDGSYGKKNQKLLLLLVPAMLGNSSEGLLSVASPVGEMILGKRVGYKFSVSSNSSEPQYKLSKIG